MSGKNLNKNYKKTASKRGSEDKIDKSRSGKIKLALPEELREKIESEGNPDEIAVEALSAYYFRHSKRSEAAVQKEIDNNIIEIQRRHISDLKEQLTASNKNYEELMKTYQAYMLQVQPLIEAAKVKELPAENAAASPEKTDTAVDAASASSQKAETTAGNNETADQTSVASSSEMASKEKVKKWYEFWK